MPITKNYFVSDLASEMKLPVLVVAQNKLGCLNHSLLTIQSIRAKNADASGLILNPLVSNSDIDSATNADVLAKIIDLPILPMLTADSAELSPGWRSLLNLESVSHLSESRTQV